MNSDGSTSAYAYYRVGSRTRRFDRSRSRMLQSGASRATSATTSEPNPPILTIAPVADGGIDGLLLLSMFEC